MKSPSIPANETKRINEVKDYDILDTLPEVLFDDITELAAQICGAPISLITLLDINRQWFKSKKGLNISETPREISFCAHAILGNGLFEIPNALKDERFFDNPLVTGEPNIRFYAGLPLVTDSGLSLGTLCVIDSKPNKLTSKQHSALIALDRQLVFLIESRLAAQKAVKLSLLLERTGEMAKVGGWQLDLSNMKMEWTNEVFNIHGLKPPNLPSVAEAIEFYAPEVQHLIKNAVNLAIADGSKWDLELPFITATGKHIWVRTQGSAIIKDSKAIRLIGAFQDITERKIAQLDLAWLNRALFMLTKCNETLIHITDETQLMIEICQITVEVGGYKMAWVGYANDDKNKSVTPKAYFGETHNFINNANLSWSEETSAGMGPGGKVIREGDAVFIEDMMLDPTYPLKKQIALEGYRGLACLPLNSKGKAFGFLALYSGEVRTFADDEIRLLQELSDNLAAGVINIRAEKERQRFQSALLSVATSVSLYSSETFFTELLKNSIITLGGQSGYISQILTKEPWSARTIAVQVNGQSVTNFDFSIHDSVSSTLFSSSEARVICDSAVIDYPHLVMMKFFEYQAFASLRLADASGHPIGLLFVLFEKAISRESVQLISSLIKIFSVRIASELERLKAASLISEQASLLDKTRDAIVVRNINHEITYWNKAAEELYGWSADEAIGKNIQVLLNHPSTEFRWAVRKLLRDGEWSGELTQEHKDGNSLSIESRWSLVKDNVGKAKSIFSIKSDISDRKVAESKIKQLAFYDPLTNLPNRRLLMDRLEKALLLTRRKKNAGAIFFIDLDNFKTLNDTLGHDKGDLLLKVVAERLQRCVRECDTVSRLGGDEFVIMLEDLSETESKSIRIASSVGEKILNELNQPADLDGYLHVITASIGITIFNYLTKDISGLLNEADAAMYKSKSTGRNKYTFFNSTNQT